MQLLFKRYLQAIKQKNFVKILSFFPASLRYRFPKQLWIAKQLGMYRTILQHSPVFANTKQARIAKIVAILKREQLSKLQAKNYIDYILTPTYAQWHLEFIKDIGFKYPDLVFEFVKNKHQKDKYYLGLYLALLLEQQSSIKDEQLSSSISQKFNSLLRNIESPIEQKILASNALSNSPQSKLAYLNDCFKQFNLMELHLRESSSKFALASLERLPNCLQPASTNQNFAKLLRKSCVTILVTSYNSQNTIEYCLLSLQQQTWQDVEIIVIDDASSDNTYAIVSAIASEDKRIKIIRLSYNVGTYGAKSIGALYATGEFLTCQDSDDFAHPQKIERQVQPLIDKETIAVTTSHWLRVDEYGQYYARQYYPFLRHNPASPMFRRQQVQTDTGLWHLVRTGADSEFFERLKLVYGKQAILAIKAPLTIASHRENSLMTSQEFGAYEYQSALDRLDYWENWRLWHIECLASQKSLKMPSLIEQLKVKQDIFTIPQKIIVNKANLVKNLENFETMK